AALFAVRTVGDDVRQIATNRPSDHLVNPIQEVVGAFELAHRSSRAVDEQPAEALEKGAWVDRFAVRAVCLGLPVARAAVPEGGVPRFGRTAAERVGHVLAGAHGA